MAELVVIPGKLFSPIQGCHAITIHIPSVIRQIFPDKPELQTYSGKKKLTFSKDEFSTKILSTSELAKLNEFKILKKQMEWLSGRYAVKLLFHAAINPNTALQDIILNHETHGAPFITSHPHIQISISHSHEYAGAIISGLSNILLGIDMEKIGKKPDEHFLKIAFTQKEISSMDKTALAIFRQWTMKEAYLKLIKKGFHEGLKQVEVINNNFFHKGLLQNVQTWSQKIHNDYMISLVWRKDNKKEGTWINNKQVQ